MCAYATNETQDATNHRAVFPFRREKPWNPLDAEGKSNAQKGYVNAVSGDQVRVVLADDEAAIRSLTKYWLEADGRFRVVGEAKDGSECITVCAEKQPDLVLLDLVMPRMGGLPALPGLKDAAPSSTVVVLSMLQEEKSIQESLNKGAAAFLDKGLDGPELAAQLWSILGRPPGPSSPVPESLVRT